MELYELRKQPHLSASSIGDYLDCGLLYKFGRIDKIKAESKSDALEFGSAIHGALADFHKEKLLGNILSANELQDCFESHWRNIAEYRDDIKYAEGNTFESIILQGRELLTAYYNKACWKDFEVIAVEEAFSFKIDGCNLPIIGAWDLVEKDSSNIIIITDFKTSARAYSIDEVDRNFQLTLYQMALKANGYQDHEILLRFDALIKTKQPKFDSYYTTRGDIDEIRAKRKIIEVSKAISKGIFIPNDSASNWKCKNCSYKKNCDDWYLQKEAA